MSAKQVNLEGKWEDKKSRISVNIPLIIFSEDNSHIVYCPPLDISGYGLTENEAYDSFNICIDEFFKYTTNKKTFFSELQRLGWTVRKSKFKAMIPPPMSKVLAENDNFSRIFNSFSFRKEDREICMPA